MVNKTQKYRNKIIQYNISRVFLMVMVAIAVSTNSHIEPDVGKGICNVLGVITLFDLMLYIFSEQYYKRLNK
ncbi:hypothetical protein ACN9SB_004584 [Salmonella enterica subsp. enterica serovar Infantis]|nr:hypothetical protein [Salmonella enterica subsp. enterica serovar Alachua]EHP0002827.1 hypothetical protein [Salmonella enterica subsp. enterica serovar Infantis]EKL6281744.1 hypothetical protein [Salmonella enterica subsp. enterica serovar Infantis]PHK65889.1 hypothetical protein CQR95_20110 [Klebsiella pneumoniae subsp. pneumoniae]RIY04063.1 hypothetical protein D3X40_27085 [Klebsiella quasipneumoniae]